MTDPTLVPDQEPDRNDGKSWSEADIEDLTLALKDGGSIAGNRYSSGTIASNNERSRASSRSPSANIARTYPRLSAPSAAATALRSFGCKSAGAIGGTS